MNLFILFEARVPPADGFEVFWSHGALRLICNHAGYSHLWTDQLGQTWKESAPAYSWPVLDGETARWSLRSAIDASVAAAFGLTRQQFEYTLSAFTHKTYPAAPQMCLVKFDELGALGIKAFSQKYDPYWNIPLNESLPKPAINLPVATQEPAADGQFALSSPLASTKRGRRIK